MTPPANLPPRADWPARPLPDLSWTSAIISILSLAIALILIGVTDLALSSRIGIFLLALVLPVAAYWSWKRGRVVWQRVRQYDQVYTSAESYARDSQQVRIQAGNLILGLIAAGVMRTFEVANVTNMQGRLQLVIGRSIGSRHGGQLAAGSSLLVVDYLNGEILGQFTVVGPASAGGHLAREFHILNAVWWGLLHQEAQRHTRPQFNAIAILLPDANGGAE